MSGKAPRLLHTQCRDRARGNPTVFPLRLYEDSGGFRQCIPSLPFCSGIPLVPAERKQIIPGEGKEMMPLRLLIVRTAHRISPCHASRAGGRMTESDVYCILPWNSGGENHTPAVGTAQRTGGERRHRNPGNRSAGKNRKEVSTILKGGGTWTLFCW